MAEIDWAYDDGLEKGRAEGRTEEREQFVRNLLAEGMPIETIARVAELPLEKVRALANRM
jgi:predicted transposase YdaD